MSVSKPRLSRLLRRLLVAPLVLGGLVVGAVGVVAEDPGTLVKAAGALAAGLAVLVTFRRVNAA